MDVGATLRRAREGRELTLSQLADRTNIPAHLLEAIERNALNEIPGGLFTRGYLRAYAAEVGLDGEALVGQVAANLPQPDTLELLRARFHLGNSPRRTAIPILLVVVCVTCFLYLMLMHESQDSAAAALPGDPQSFQAAPPDGPLTPLRPEINQ